jgi:solute carrier family 25 (mitochondrial folate transporter), member 32
MSKVIVLFLLVLMTRSTESTTLTKAVSLSKRTSMLPRHTTGSASFLPQKYSTPSPPAPQRDIQYIWSSLVAGVGSGILASIICAPLDVLRTRLQVWGDLSGQKVGGLYVFQQIFQNEGWKGGFRGLGATLITVPLFWGLYFPLYDDLKRTFQTPERNPSLVHCGSAILAGAAADVVCNPMFVVRTRLQTEALHGSRIPHGIFYTIHSLYKEGGPYVFWRGMTASLMGLSHVAVQFPLYELLKKQARLRSKSDQENTPLEILVSSGLSKMCASLLTYPHEVVRSRMMDARTSQTLTGTLHRIYAHEGVWGFYSGLHISLLRVVPNCCITFLTYELLLRWTKEQVAKNRK